MKKIVLALAACGLLMTTSCTKTGPAGPAGNANVISSGAYTIGSSQWSYDAASASYFCTVNNPNITADVLANGVLEVYKEYSSGWTNLPDIDNGVSTVFNMEQGAYTISVFNINGSLPSNPGSVTFRDVVIPRSVRLSHPQTNWANYNETMAVAAGANAPAAGK